MPYYAYIGVVWGVNVGTYILVPWSIWECKHEQLRERPGFVRGREGLIVPSWLKTTRP